jgi:hypothetical protein
MEKEASVTLASDLRHDFFHVCVFIAANAFLCNWMPPSILLKEHPRTRYAYEILVDLVAGFGLNWRERLPSLDREFPGFRKMLRHGYRNWLQVRMDEHALQDRPTSHDRT